MSFRNEARHLEKLMRTVAIMLGGAGALLSSLVVAPSSSARAAEVPSYFKEIVGTEVATPAEIGTKNILQLNTTMFELYGNAGADVQEEHPRPAPGHPRPVLGRRRALHPLSPRDAAARSAVGSDCLSAAQIRRSQHHGAGGSGRALSQQPQRPDLARPGGGVPQPHAIRPRRPRRGPDAGTTGSRPAEASCRTTSRSWTTASRTT